MAELAPQNEDELAELIRGAAAGGRRLSLRGAASKAGTGAPTPEADVVDLGALRGILAYEPNELVLTARAATPLHEIESALAAHHQMLAFEPPDATGAATLGGVIAAAASGPRRVSAGAARDHVLGFEAVSGRGERFIAGGKVVKNVTGYDLPKLMAGSWGRLSALTTITVKVLPRPQAERTLMCEGLSCAGAVAAMSAALASPAVVSCAAHFPASASTALRLEGAPAAIDARVRMLQQQLSERGPARVLDHEASAALWRVARDVETFASARVLWRLVCAPSRMPGVIGALGLGDGAWCLDWAGGLAWIADVDDAASLRAAAGAAGGHATLARAPESMRRATPAFHPQPPALAALAARVRRAFDPNGVFETGRFADPADAD